MEAKTRRRLLASNLHSSVDVEEIRKRSCQRRLLAGQPTVHYASVDTDYTTYDEDVYAGILRIDLMYTVDIECTRVRRHGWRTAST